MIAALVIPSVEVKEPFYQAIGWLKGTLTFVPATEKESAKIPSIVLEDGTEVPVSGIKPSLLQWATRHPDELNAIWCVYPRQGPNGFTVFLSNRWIKADGQEIHNGFRIQGRIKSNKGDAITVSIERNMKPADPKLQKLPQWKGFVLKLKGTVELPEGTFVQAVCKLNSEGKLWIESIEKVQGFEKPRRRIPVPGGSEQSRPVQRTSSPRPSRPDVKRQPLSGSEKPASNFQRPVRRSS